MNSISTIIINKELDFRKVELYKLTTFCLYGSVV